MTAISSAALWDIRRESPKVGRNELCPCGSGKKYKRCCLDNPAPWPTPHDGRSLVHKNAQMGRQKFNSRTW
jgi:hypothetical protein